MPQGESLTLTREIFNVIIDNVGKVTDGKPNCNLYYVTTGTYKHEPEIEATFENIRRDLVNTGYFNEIVVEPVDKDKIIKLWTSTWATIQAKFDVKGYTPFPEIAGITEAYLAVVPAKRFVDEVLSDGEGKLRTYAFQENVRSFLGEDNRVNHSIKSTLEDEVSKERFSILNNGITIISPDVRVQSDTISIDNFQIVNGCQTSHVLYNNKELLSEKVMVTLKIIETDDPNVIGEVVKATNSQTKIDEIQFLSLRPIVRKIEEYFNAINNENEDDVKLYFERKDRQYYTQSIPEIRIFDIKDTSRAVASMFLERPDLAARYPTQMFKELDDTLFNGDNREIIYYTAALALYRLHLLTSNNRIPCNYRKYKWHMLMILKYVIKKEKQPNLTSKKIETYCGDIIRICHDVDNNMCYFNEVRDIISKVGEVDRDVLKTKKHIDKLKREVFNRIKAVAH